MITITFQAHNSPSWHEITTLDVEAAYKVVCALNFTAYSFSVFNASGADITDSFENRIAEDSDLPVARVAGHC